MSLGFEGSYVVTRVCVCTHMRVHDSAYAESFASGDRAFIREKRIHILR